MIPVRCLRIVTEKQQRDWQQRATTPSGMNLIQYNHLHSVDIVHDKPQVIPEKLFKMK